MSYLDISVWSPKAHAKEIGSFDRVNNQSWYGSLETDLDYYFSIPWGNYYKYSLTNTLGSYLTVGSFTAVQ